MSTFNNSFSFYTLESGYLKALAPKQFLESRVMGISRWFLKYTVFDLVLMASLAALGIAIKPVIVPLVHFITGPLLIPGGSVAGGIYMMWIVLGVALVGKAGSGTIIASVQAVVVIATGISGSHGILSIVTYLLPGIAVDATLFLLKKVKCYKIKMFVCGMTANVFGTLLSNILFFRLPTIPLLLSLSAGAFSGGIGGLIAYGIRKRLMVFGLFEHSDKHMSADTQEMQI
ncbi:energy-coupling factor transport system substrate-specific component [Hydrogenoanaerobacterium saccharovorans]|uniref:Energy-coupling factor transport system substrate-specific component n=2 Tax=Hydrogenoanaerobacterium saccharovorans TaxID=474960 RepID=A0A1H7Z9H7_9FIRM|nr:energy-coupling factor transport system substrate-specific component [Hydrogenoanaerobacterium saccharovorans]SEM54883.1 energy-coupling factor transport system substrate-specific component [Hydrogenoanaerobacterium saccharovorans]